MIVQMRWVIAICCPKGSMRSSVPPGAFGRGLKRSGGPSKWIVSCHRTSCRLPCIECHHTDHQRHLVILAPHRGACDGFLHCSLCDQLARKAAGQTKVVVSSQWPQQPSRARNQCNRQGKDPTSSVPSIGLGEGLILLRVKPNLNQLLTNILYTPFLNSLPSV